MCVQGSSSGEGGGGAGVNVPPKMLDQLPPKNNDIILPRCACASEVYSSVFVCLSVCLHIVCVSV